MTTDKANAEVPEATEKRPEPEPPPNWAQRLAQRTSEARKAKAESDPGMEQKLATKFFAQCNSAARSGRDSVVCRLPKDSDIDAVTAILQEKGLTDVHVSDAGDMLHIRWAEG